MKKIMGVIVVCAVLFVAMTVSAETSGKEAVTLEIPAGLVQNICTQPVWNGVTAVWSGVTDTRQDKVIGIQTKKGKEAVEVFANPSLESVFDKALREVFTACGMKIVNTPGGETLKLSAEIRQFYAGVEKKLVTGKAKCTSALTFTVDKGAQSTKIDISNDLESKEARKGDIKGLTKALNDLLVETLKQIPSTQQLREIGQNP